MQYVAAVDQGTTGTRTMLFDRHGEVRGEAYERHEQYYPNPGWVEHDPIEIFDSVVDTFHRALADAGVAATDVAAIGIANQRETTVLWDRDTGSPIHNAIVWQDRRTTDRIEALEGTDMADSIRTTTGLEPDAYFSATKLEWLLDRADQNGASGESTELIRDRAERGDLCFGTIDSWLVWKLTGAHITDVTNASRTMLFDIHELAWDRTLLEEFRIPESILPEVRPSSDETVYGYTDESRLGATIPVAAVLGDQQAALFGQTCFDSGDAKNTYGTGSFLLLNTGSEPISSDHGLLTTVGFQRSGEPARYALEGSIFVTGAAIEWLADVGIVENVTETESLAQSVESTDDVYFVPAFSGLGAPHWDQRARGTIVGMTRGTEPAHLVRATLSAIAFRTREVVEAMLEDSGLSLGSLRVDGGAVENDFLCQHQADALGTDILRPKVDETTSLGAAYAAGLAVGYWESVDDLRSNWHVDRRFEPESALDAEYERWKDAVDRSREWARE